MFMTIIIGMVICAAIGLIIAAFYILLTEFMDNPSEFVLGTIIVFVVLGIFYAVGRIGAVWLL